MKNLIIYLLIFAALASLLACQDSGDDMESIEPENPKYLYFELEQMSSKEGEEVLGIHNYVEKGYSLVINDLVYYDVNISEPFPIDASGDVTITLSHPDFDPDRVMEEAYYAIDSSTLDFETQDEVSVNAKLLQGYVIVTTDESLDTNNYNLRVNQVASIFEETYYLTSAVSVIEIVSNGLITDVGELNVIGEGVDYYAFENNDGHLIISK